jgi:hypothetical protein
MDAGTHRLSDLQVLGDRIGVPNPLIMGFTGATFPPPLMALTP